MICLDGFGPPALFFIKKKNCFNKKVYLNVILKENDKQKSFDRLSIDHFHVKGTNFKTIHVFK